FSPFTFLSMRHSTCNWQSPNFCFDCMSPVPGFIVSALSATVHFASSPFACFQLLADVPLKSITASDGASLLVLPGVTTFTSGFHISVVGGSFCAKRLVFAMMAAQIITDRCSCIKC